MSTEHFIAGLLRLSCAWEFPGHLIKTHSGLVGLESDLSVRISYKLSSYSYAVGLAIILEKARLCEPQSTFTYFFFAL